MCASKCVTAPAVYSQPSSRRLSSWASLSFATAALIACQLWHTHVLYVHSSRHAKRAVSIHQHMHSPSTVYIYIVYSCTSNAHTCRLCKIREEGCDREKLNTHKKNVLTSADALIPALKQPLQFACSVRQCAPGTAEYINYIYTAIDPLSNPTDYLHLLHVRPNCKC